MNRFQSMVFVCLLASMSARADTVNELECRDTSGLPNGLVVSVDRDTDTGELEANLTNRDNLGPYESLGSIPVRCGFYPAPNLVARLACIGNDFTLRLLGAEGGEGPEMYRAKIVVTANGRKFDQKMRCFFPSENNDPSAEN